MTDQEPDPEQLRKRQLDQETAERRLLEQAASEADAERHRRRADKAQYLRAKLEEQQEADREADTESSQD